MWKVALVSQNVQNLKKDSPKETRENSWLTLLFFGYADVLKCQKNLMISCERAQITTAHIISARAVIKLYLKGVGVDTSTMHSSVLLPSHWTSREMSWRLRASCPGEAFSRTVCLTMPFGRFSDITKFGAKSSERKEKAWVLGCCALGTLVSEQLLL